MPKPISLPARAATADEAYDDEEDYEGEDEPNMKFIHALFVVLILHVIAVGGIFAFNSMKAKQTAKAASKTPVAADTAKTDAAAPAATPAAVKPATNASLAGWKGKTHEVVAGDTLARIAASYKVSAEAIGKENNITTYSMLRVGQVLKIPAGDKASTKPATAETAKHASDSANKQAFLATKTDVSTKPAVIAAVPKASAEAETPSAPAAETKTPAAASASEAGVYVVAKGENPYSIAKKLHVSYSELLAANGIKDPTKIQIGQKLKIPEKKN